MSVVLALSRTLGFLSPDGILVWCPSAQTRSSPGASDCHTLSDKSCRLGFLPFISFLKSATSLPPSSAAI